MKISRILSSAMLAVGATLASMAVAVDYLMVPSSASASRGIYRYNASTGALIGVPLTPWINFNTTVVGGTPKEIIQIGNRLWVADQIADKVFIFDLLGNLVQTIATGLDNIRGLGYAPAANAVYVTNDGGNNGATINSVVKFDLSGNQLAVYTGPYTSPFDVHDTGTELLVSCSDTHNIYRVGYNGANLGTFHSGAMRFPQQIHWTGSTYLVAAFSPPSGIYELASSGAQLAVYAPGLGQRGAYKLPNGDILFTKGDGTWLLPVGTTTPVQMSPGNMQYISKVTIPTVRFTVDLEYWEPLGVDAPLTLDVTDPSTGNLISSNSITVADDGTFEVEVSTVPGTYNVGLKGSHWLRKQVNSVTFGANGATGLNFFLLNGDVTNDNEVGPADFTALSAAFGSFAGDPNYNVNADLNGDGEVGPGDFTRLSANFGQMGD